MNTILRNIIGLLVGIIIGSAVNMLLIMVSSSIIPPPEGANLTTPEGLQASMHLMKPKHYLFPFLAHALGTLSGAFLAALIAGSHKIKFAFTIGLFFLAGGITSVFMLPSPTWFTALDLIVAYLPMAYLGWKLAVCKKS